MLSNYSWILSLLLLGLSGGTRVDYYKILAENNSIPFARFDIDADNSRLIVGQTNRVFNLNFELNNATNIVPYDTKLTGDFDTCVIKGLLAKMCQNFHYVVLKASGMSTITDDDDRSYAYDDLVLMCSSHAYKPECIYRTTSDLRAVKTVGASTFIPSRDGPPIPAILFGNSLMTAPHHKNQRNQMNTKTRFIPRSLASIDDEAGIISGLSDENWFVEPSFVSIHDIGDYFYIFFREKAKERQRDVLYSRVGRVCKNDVGGPFQGHYIYSTFVKARISCDRGGDDGLYHYDEIQDTYYDEQEGLLYAIFTATRYGPIGSALCKYSYNTGSDDLFRVFNGFFYVQSGSNTLSPTRVAGNFGCDRSLTDAMSYQFILNRTKSISTKPPIIQDGYSFRKMTPPILINGFTVLFITATKEYESDLYVMKYIKPYFGETFILLQLIPLPNDLNSLYVNQMVLHGEGLDAHIFIGTSNGIYRVPVQSCADYTLCVTCVLSGDPYCFYDSKKKKCVAMIDSGNQLMKKNVSECLNIPPSIVTASVTENGEQKGDTDSDKDDLCKELTISNGLFNVCIRPTREGIAGNYMCMYGFKLVGNRARVCQASGQWSGSDAQCVKQSELKR